MDERRSSLTWRAAQAWLAGYSDGLEHAEGLTRDTWYDAGYAEDYARGYDHGVSKRNDAARTAR